MEPVGGFRPGRWLLGRGWWFLPLLLSAAISIPWVCGERWYSDASYYQAIATQMVREGTWWYPMQGDIPYFNKPPLAFWLHAITVLLGGSSNLAAHIPEGITFVAMSVLIAWIVRRIHGTLAGVIAGCVLAMTNDWIVRVGNFKLDMLHTFWVFAALACWMHACLPRSHDDSDGTAATSDRRCWYILAGLFIGAALLTKPFYGLAAPLFFIGWLALTPLVSRRRVGLVLLGAVIGIAIAAPWYVSMIGHYGQAFIRAHISEQTVARAMGEMHDAQGAMWYLRLIFGVHLESIPGAPIKWIQFPEAIEPAKMWPIYLGALAGVASVAFCWSDRAHRRGGMFATLWLVVWLLALSCFGGKRNYYLMIIHPATAWLAALAVVGVCRTLCGPADIEGSRVRSWIRGAAVAGLIASIVLLIRAPFVVAAQRDGLANRERDAFMEFMRGQHAAGRDVYDCGLSYRISSLAYIEAGFWPHCPSERTSYTPESIPGGALMAYKADMLERSAYGTFIDQRDKLVFRSEPAGQFLVYERHAEAVPRSVPIPISK